MENEEDIDFELLKKYWWVLAIVPFIFISYAALVLYLTSPVTELSLAKSGSFGDTFGVVNALFSGMALLGVVATVLLQQKEMKQNRAEFKKGAAAQEKTATLTALSTLLDEYNHRYKLNEEIVKGPSMTPFDIVNEQDEIIKKRGKIIAQLEELTGLANEKT